jgi:ribosomal protein S18 acetylase RimI-like enzyme
MEILPLKESADTLDSLAALLVTIVAGGASVSFMHPLSLNRARSFWVNSFKSVKKNQRVILGAWENDALAGTVTVLFDMPDNQPHRAEIAKLMVTPTQRGRGIARALMQTAEAVALAKGRTHLLLDTATDGGAAGLYEGMGYECIGEIPDYALKPHGGLSATKLYFKRIGLPK